MSAMKLGHTLRLLADTDSFIADEADKATVRAAAEVIDRCMPTAPEIVIVHGSGADYTTEQLNIIRDHMFEVIDDLHVAIDGIDNMKLHVRSQKRGAS